MYVNHQPADRGLTPVVGIVLLVAITLLLAATVAAFAFGIEDETARTKVPTTAVDFEYDYDASGDDSLQIVHKSGQSVEATKLRIDVEEASCSGGSNPNGQHDATTWLSGKFSGGGTIAIDGSTLCPSGDLDLRSATVRVVWTSNTGSSAMLQSWTGPG